MYVGSDWLCGILFPKLVLNPDPRCALGIPSFWWHIKMRSHSLWAITDPMALLVRLEALPWTCGKMPTQRVKFQLLKILQYFIDCSVICLKDCLACGGGQLSVDIFFFQRWLHFSSAFTQPLCKNILACWSKWMLHKINYFWLSSGHFSVNKYISYKTYKIVNCEGWM